MSVFLSPVGGAGAQFFDNNGNPLTGGKLYTYAAGTTTPQATYTSSAGSVFHSNPIILDAAGRVSGSSEIWLASGSSYKFVLKDANDVLLATWDDVFGNGDPAFNSYTPDANSLLAPGPVTVENALNQITDEDAGASVVGYLLNLPNAVAQTVEAKLAQTVSVKDFGATGDGVTNDTTAIQTAIDALSSNSTLVFPAGVYKINQIIFDGLSNLTVTAYGARFLLTGDNAGFLVKGACAGIYVQGGTLVGDGVNRDASPSTAQVGWLFGNETGAYVQNIFVQDVIVDNANIGFKFAAGTGTGSGNANNVKISRCQAKDIVGTVGGVGYGFQFSQAPNSTISDCQAINCGRHGIYFAEGRNYVATNCVIRDHRSTVYTAAYRVAFSISRSRNVAVSNCVFDNCYDGTVEIDVDTQGTAPDNVSVGTVLSNCTFLNSALADIRIGTVPAIDGICYDVVVSNCVMVRPGTNGVSSIVIEGGNRIKIDGCLIDGPGTSSSRAIGLNGASGASYTDNVEITNNQISGWDYGVQFESVLLAGSSKIQVFENQISALTAEFDFVGGEDTITNNNLIYKRSNGKNANRAYTSSGSNVVIPVGGLDVLIMSASGATTVSNFSGGTEGQELMCYFTNGNTTLLNTNLYTAGALNFVGSQYDTITFVYLGGFWREKCRSLN